MDRPEQPTIITLFLTVAVMVLLLQRIASSTFGTGLYLRYISLDNEKIYLKKTVLHFLSLSASIRGTNSYVTHFMLECIWTKYSQELKSRSIFSCCNPEITTVIRVGRQALQL